MGRKIKAGTKGAAAQYITRSNAIRRLQVTLQDFRRLCILKGVYPREPKKKLKGTDKTYFHLKDLKILEHDVLLAKFMDIKAHLKKYKKLQGQKEFKRAEELKEEKPRYTLSHVIKERYPTFQDALKDLDDALCLISLFANFPQHQSLSINAKEIEMAQKLYSEWMNYCTISQCFKKSFLSIKGIYFQVELMGQNITWVAPYSFNQRLPFDIDYKVIGTFMEFYTALLRFINFKLYKDIGLSYPPQKQTNYLEDSDFLNSKIVHTQQNVATKKFDSQINADIEQIGVSTEFKDTPELLALTKKQGQIKKQRKLFSKCTFMFSREVGNISQSSLQFLVLSFGGQFVTPDEDDSKVTHYVMDRPVSDAYLNARQNKEFIQPQYIMDSINNLYLLPTSQYKPGTAPPAHLSPFMDNEAEGYVPMRHKEIQHLKGEEVVESESEDEEMVVEEVKPKKAAAKKTEKKVPAKKGKGDADSSSDEESSDDGAPVAQSAKERKKANDKIKKDLELESKEMAKTLMTNRQRKLYQKVQGEIDEKKELNKHLKVKRKLIEKKKK